MTHKGIDPGAIARALLADLRTHSLAEGGSTLTQQLAKNELFTQDKHLARKAAEMLAAFDLEKTYSKQQIFEMYANTIYFGSGYYGIAEAAEGYFGKEPAQLTDAEAIYLAGMPNAPSTYASSPELAFKRMQVVLKRMVKCRVLTQQQADALAADAENLTVYTRHRALSAADQTRRGVLFCGIWFGKGGIMLPVQAVAAPPVGSIIIPKNFCETMFFL